MALFDIAGTRLMIALDPERPQERPVSIIYFDAPDFEATLAGLSRRKISLVETVQRTAAGDLKLQQFRDPDGNALAIMAIVPAVEPRP